MRSLFRKIHRWLGLLMALQIIAWMVSGLWFSLFPIEQIRGEHLTAPLEPLAASDDASTVDSAPPATLLRQALDAHFEGPWRLQSASLMRHEEEVLWRVSGTHNERPFSRLVGADGVLQPLSRDEALRLARDRVLNPGTVRDVQWLEQAPPDSEVRGRSLPLWQVSFEQPESLNLYLDPWTGEVAARRTGRWRIFDFLWMLHIMDFEARDDFNHPLLQIAAFLGLVIALGGVVLWTLTTPLFRRRVRVR